MGVECFLLDLKTKTLIILQDAYGYVIFTMRIFLIFRS